MYRGSFALRRLQDVGMAMQIARVGSCGIVGAHDVGAKTAVKCGPHFGPLLIDLIHGFVYVPIVFERMRHELGETPRPACQKILGCGRLGHYGHVWQTFRTILQCHEMPVNRDTLDAEAVRALQNGGIAWIRVCSADRSGEGARFDGVAMLAAVWRSGSHAHSLTQAVRRLMRTHVDDVDFEIRIQRIVVHHGQRNILTMLAGAFEACEAHIIFHIGFARNERLELAFRRIGGQQQHLRGGLGTGTDHDVALVERQTDTHPETLIGFTEHFHIVGDRRSHMVAHNHIRTPRIVEQGVEDPLRIRRKTCPGDPLEHLRQFFAGLEIAYTEIVAFIATRIDAIEQPTAVLGDIHAADAEEIVSFRLGIGIEYDSFTIDRHTGFDMRRIPIIIVANRQAALHSVLLALLGTGEIPVAVHARRYRHVGFLHMRLEFLEQRGAQRFQGFHTRRAIPVLRGHIFPYFR